MKIPDSIQNPMLQTLIRLQIRILRDILTCVHTSAEWMILNYPDGPIGYALRRGLLNRRGSKLAPDFLVAKGCRISDWSLIEGGQGSGIAENCSINLGPGQEKLLIGRDSFVGPESYIRNANHIFDDPNVPIMKQGHESKNIIIGDNVWVGARCVLLGGTKIGEGVVLAAGSVVSFEIPPWTVAGGNPARVLKKRNQNVT